jgi:uncharacterized protein (DUF1810 family)
MSGERREAFKLVDVGRICPRCAGGGKFPAGSGFRGTFPRFVAVAMVACDSGHSGALLFHMSLERFREAQDKDGMFERAVGELRAGQKRSHWIWFVFPQLAGLGRSSTARYYALRDAEEAGDYLRDEVLRARLIEATETVANRLARGAILRELMGGEVDALKLVSSLTLFECVAAGQAANDEAMARIASLCGRVLSVAGQQGYTRCASTLRECGEPS